MAKNGDFMQLMTLGTSKWHSPDERGDVGQIDPCPKAQGHFDLPSETVIGCFC